MYDAMYIVSLHDIYTRDIRIHVKWPKPVDPDPVQWLVTYMYLCMYLCLIDVNALVFLKNIHQSLVYKRVQHVYTGLGCFSDNSMLLCTQYTGITIRGDVIN